MTLAIRRRSISSWSFNTRETKSLSDEMPRLIVGIVTVAAAVAAVSCLLLFLFVLLAAPRDSSELLLSSDTETVATCSFLCVFSTVVGKIASKDSFVSGAILTLDSVCLAFDCLGLFRERWQTISKQRRGWSRRNKGWWNAPVSGPRVAWRNPLKR